MISNVIQLIDQTSGMYGIKFGSFTNTFIFPFFTKVDFWMVTLFGWVNLTN